MTVEEEIKALGKKARAAAHAMRALDTAAKNAALLAAQILAVEDAALAEKLGRLCESDAKTVLAKDAAVMEMI